MHSGEVKSRAGLGLAVSTLHSVELEADCPLSDDQKTLVDWCKDGDLPRVQQLLSSHRSDIDRLDDNVRHFPYLF